MNGIIDVQSFGLDSIYLKLDDASRYEACVKVLSQSLKSIDMTNNFEIKREYVNKLLDRSIKYYLKIEEYESVRLLSDIQEVLNSTNYIESYKG